jgi:hypothetical protein
MKNNLKSKRAENMACCRGLDSNPSSAKNKMTIIIFSLFLTLI